MDGLMLMARTYPCSLSIVPSVSHEIILRTLVSLISTPVANTRPTDAVRERILQSYWVRAETEEG